MSAENASFFLFFLEGGNDGVEDLFFLEGGNDNDCGDIFDNDVAEDVLHTDGGDIFDNDVAEDVLHTDGGDDVDPHVHACDSMSDFSIFLKQIGHVTISSRFLFVVFATVVVVFVTALLLPFVFFFVVAFIDPTALLSGNGLAGTIHYLEVFCRQV